MGPLSELAAPLEPVHPNPVNNLAGARHSDRTESFYPLLPSFGHYEFILTVWGLCRNWPQCFRASGATQMCGAPAPRLALK